MIDHANGHSRHHFERICVMAKRLIHGMMAVVAAGLLCFLSSCSTPETSGEASAKPKITYKCLSSSCDATSTCDEGDPVPEHCGKRMIR